MIHLNRLPYEVIADAEKSGAMHQVYLSLAMLRRRNRKQKASSDYTRKTPRKWRRIHSDLDRAAAALSR